MDKNKLAKKLGISVSAIDAFDNPPDPNDQSAIKEFLTQRCEDCGSVIKVHETAKWRLSIHRIRCDKCAELAGGGFEGIFVD